MIHFPQKLDFAKNALCIRIALKQIINALYSYGGIFNSIKGFENNRIGATANDSQWFVALRKFPRNKNFLFHLLFLN